MSMLQITGSSLNTSPLNNSPDEYLVHWHVLSCMIFLRVLQQHNAGAILAGKVQSPDNCLLSVLHTAKLTSAHMRQSAFQQPLYVQVEVVDNQDGTYNMMYSLSSEGDHTLHPQVDGNPLRQHGFPVMAAFGPLQAQDVVASLQDQDEGHICGGVCSVHVKVACLPTTHWCRMWHTIKVLSLSSLSPFVEIYYLSSGFSVQ